MRMRTVAAALVLGLGCTPAWAVTAEDFDLLTTEDLVKVCSVSADDPLYSSARSLCLGYVAGVMHYHDELTKGPEFDPLVCPKGDVSRDEVVDVFLAWAKKSSGKMKVVPVHSVIQASEAKWPCTTR